MEERKFINLKKEEFGIKEYIKRDLGRGKISRLDIEYTPVGEKIIILTSRPGFVIGRKGEKIEQLTQVLKTRFKLENPHIEISEIKNPLFDAQLVADDIAMDLERMGNLKFKVIAYRKLQDIIKGGALGCELRISGKLPSDRAKSWRFAEGYLKKAGESRKEVNRAQSVALTKSGVIGIKVAIMPPDAIIYDKIDISEQIISQLKSKVEEVGLKKKEKKIKDNSTVNKEDKKKEKKNLIAESDNLEINSVENGTAIKIEEELEEGVPQEQINKDIKDNKIIKHQKSKEDRK
jgi:small subunit ribosomal protein S3